MKHMTLREARQRRGLTQEALEAKSGVGQAVISRLETEPGANPKVATVRKLEAALGLKPGQLAIGRVA